MASGLHEQLRHHQASPSVSGSAGAACGGSSLPIAYGGQIRVFGPAFSFLGGWSKDRLEDVEAAGLSEALRVVSGSVQAPTPPACPSLPIHWRVFKRAFAPRHLTRPSSAPALQRKDRMRAWRQSLTKLEERVWAANGAAGPALRSFKEPPTFSRLLETQLVQRGGGAQPGTQRLLGCSSSWPCPPDRCMHHASWDMRLLPCSALCTTAGVVPPSSGNAGSALRQQEMIWIRSARGRWVLVEAMLDSGVHLLCLSYQTK